MNAEELEDVLGMVEKAKRLVPRLRPSEVIAQLDVLWATLDQHRLEMVAAEAARKCAVCHHRVCVVNSSLCAGCYETVTGQSEAPTLVAVGDLATRRDLERIENRLGEIEDRQNRHLKVFHDVPDAG